MIVELTQLPVQTEHTAAFESGWQRAAEILVKQPGYVTHRIGKTIEEPDLYVLEIEWASLEAHTKEFTNDSSFADFLNCFVPYLSGDARIMHFTPDR